MALSPSDIFLRDWLADFPFANEESYRHALELARFARRPRRGPGRAPIFVITGRAGVGKSLLAQVLTGAIPSTLPERAEDTEKTVGSMLAAGRQVLLFDNVDDITSLQVRILEDVATQDTFHVRAFGRAALADVSTNGAVIVITANAGDIRPAFVGAFRGDVVEIALSRTVPFDVNTLKHRDILAFTEANETAIDAALPRFLYHVEDLAEAIDLFERFEEVHGVRLGRVDGRAVVHASAPLAPTEPVMMFNRWAFGAGYLVEEGTVDRVVDFLTNVRGAPSLREIAALAATTDPAGHDYAVESLERAAAAIAASPENRHHDTCYMQARLMGSYLAGGLPLKEEEVVKSLLAAGASDRAVRAGIEAGKGSPIQWPPACFVRGTAPAL